MLIKDLEINKTMQITKIDDSNPEIINTLYNFDIKIGNYIKIIRKSLFKNSFQVQIDNKRLIVIGKDYLNTIHVSEG